jgi:hypothetical protein
MKNLTIGVDIDDTLTIPEVKRISQNYREYYRDLKPDRTTIAQIRILKRMGLEIFIFTSRPISDLRVTLSWLKKHKVPFNHLIMDKPLFDIYIDRDSFTPESLTSAEIDRRLKLKNRKPWEGEE